VTKLTPPFRLLIGLVITLLVGTLIPGSVKAEIEGHFWAALPWSGMAHFVLFCAIAAVPVYGRGPKAVGAAVLLGLLLAVGTELLQHWVPGRYPTVRDVLIDLAGALAGCALQVRVRRLRAIPS
jgi:VanZ family protein